MRKTTLKSTLRVFLLFLVTLVTGGGYALAEEAVYKTLTFSKDTNGKSVSAYNVSWTATVDNFTWDIANFNNNNNGWTYIKCGSKNAASTATITNKSAFDKPISKVVVTIDKVTAASVKSIKLDVYKGAVSGEATESVSADAIKTGELTFSITTPDANNNLQLVFDCEKGSSNGLIQVSKVEYYADIESGGDTQQKAAAPTLTEAGEFDTAEKVVTITNNEEGATVYYTTDRNAPTTESASFTGASKDITITATTTVKAMATVSGKNNSPVASATYTKSLYTSIADFIAAKPTTNVKLQLTDALTYGNKEGKNVYLHDGTGMIQLYDSNGKLPETIKYGTKVTAIFQGSYALFNGQDEMQNATLVGDATITDVATPYDSKEVTISELTKDMVGQQVTLKNVRFKTEALTSNYVVVTQGTNEIQVFNTMKVLDNAKFRTDVDADVSGFVLYYEKNNNKTIEIVPEGMDCIVYAQSFAEAPTLTAEGEFTGSKEVTITNNEEGGTVYYTTDGSDPTTDSPSFTGESKTLTLTATTTVKAMAVAEGKEQSTVASATYTMVAATPELTFAQNALEVGFGETTIPQNALTCTSDGQVTYTSSDPTVATVAQDGTVTYVAPGLTTITATAAATDTYQEGTASYTLLLVSGDGTWEHPYSPVDAVNASSIENNTKVWVKGVYKGMPSSTGVDGTFSNTAMALYSGNDAPSALNTIAVEIPKDVKWREAFCTEKNVEDGVTVTAYGTFYLRANGKGGYFGRSGIKGTTKISVSNSTMTIGETGYATYYDSLKVVLADGIQGGVITETDGNRLIIDYKYSSDNAIAAETAVLLKGAPGEYPIVYTTGNATGSSTNLLRGTLTNALTTAPEEGTDYNFYMLSLDKNSQNIGFYWGEEDGAAFENKAGHAYLAVPKSTAQSVKGFSITDLETGLSQVEASDSKSGAVYDLQGRRVNRAAHGLYIQNGHVVLVK